MSCQKGNASRTRAQKHKNRAAFKNTLHDTSQRTKTINNIDVYGVCQRCKEIIEWRIRYKKYKPLSQPKTCVKCQQKAVRHAYHVMCQACGVQTRLCTKCCKSEETVQASIKTGEEQLKLDQELKQLLDTLPERRRRTFLRYMNRTHKEGEPPTQRDDLVAKLNSLNVAENEADEFDCSDFESDADD